MIVRGARESDTSTIACNNMKLAIETEGKRLDQASAIRGVQEVLSDSCKGFYLVAEENGAIVGQCLITSEWSDWRNGSFWWIQSVYVDKDQRSKGIFSSIFKEIQSMARERKDIVGLRLYVDQKNITARSTYSRLGMKESNYAMYEMDMTRTGGD